MATSLQDLSSVMVAIVLSNHPECKKEIFSEKAENCAFTRCESLLEDWNKSVQGKVKLILNDFPYRLRGKIPVSLITLIGIKMVDWAKYHNKEFGLSFNFCRDFLRSSFFTAKGTIDKEIAARDLIKESSLCIMLRYRIACCYCLTDVVPTLWDQIAKHERIRNTGSKGKSRETFGVQDEMLEFWYYYMMKNVKTLLKRGVKETEENIFSYAYSIAVKSRNEVAATNCWKMLGPELRENVAHLIFEKLAIRLVGSFLHSEVSFACYEPYFDMVKAIFYQLEKDVRKKLMSREISFLVLKCFLNWPYQDLFMDSVELVWENLPKSKYYSLLHGIVDKIEDKYLSHTYNYRSLLKDFWNQSPLPYKRFVLSVKESDGSLDEEGIVHELAVFENSHKYGFLVKKLFKLENFTDEDESNVRSILESATPEERQKIAARQGGCICKDAIIEGNFALADLFISCIYQEKKDISEFKKNLISLCASVSVFKKLVLEGNLDRAEEIIKWAVSSDEIEDFKKSLLSVIPLKSISQYCLGSKSKSSKVRINNFIKWILPNNDIEESKKRYLLQQNFPGCFRYSFYKFEPREMEQFLQWFFSTKKAVKNFKRELAFQTLQNNQEHFDLKHGIHFIEKFIKWCELSNQESKAFAKQLAYTNRILNRCTDNIINHNLEKIDEFVLWSKLPKKDIREFKRHLIFSEDKIFTTYSDFIIKGKQEEVDNFIKWSDLSEEDVEIFKKRLALSQDELLSMYKTLIIKGKLKDIEEILQRFPFSETELQDFRKKIVVQNYSAFESLILDSKWKEVEALLRWCCTSEDSVNQFKNENFLNTSSNGYNIYFQIIVRKKYEEAKKYLDWLGVKNEKEQKEFKSQVLFNTKVFQSICKFLVENDKEVLKESWQGFLSNKREIQKFTKSFLGWYNQQIFSNCCVNCGGKNLDTEHTYNVNKTPVFCYKAMRQVPDRESMVHFQLLINEYLLAFTSTKSSKRSTRDVGGPSKRRKL